MSLRCLLWGEPGRLHGGFFVPEAVESWRRQFARAKQGNRVPFCGVNLVGCTGAFFFRKLSSPDAASLLKPSRAMVCRFGFRDSTKG